VFLAGLGGGPAFLGVVEGVAESTAALLKLVSGAISDRVARRKPLVVLGYGLASVVRPLIAIARAPWHVLAVRFADRIGKGLRTSPRDALLADAAPADMRGRAYGFHRSMDHLGAVLGPIAAFLLVGYAGVSYRGVFALAAIPAAAAVLTLVLAVREPAREKPAESAPRKIEVRPPDVPAFRRYLVVLAVFTLGNSSDAFLLLRAADLGVREAHLPLLWSLFHVVKSALATPLGALSDKVGRRSVIATGFGIYAVAYAGFAAAAEAWHAWALFAFYGTFFAFTEGAEKALVADLVPASARGRAFGAFHFVVGVLALPSSALFGLMWRLGSPALAFGVGAGLALAAALLLVVLVRPPPAAC
jgi:MFS family permease